MQLFLKVILLSFFLASCSSNIEVKELSKTHTSWDGNKVFYPKGQEEITAMRVTLPPKAKFPYHCHPFPTLAYVLSGKIKVEKMSGETKLFKEGDVIVEVVNDWHRGFNPSKIHPVSIIVFYTGQKSAKNTIIYKKGQESCI